MLENRMKKFDRELSGRVAMAEIRSYDAETAELFAGHMAEKAKVRNRRRQDRKHKLTPKMRKEQEFMRKDHLYGYAWNLDCVKVRFAPDSEPIKTRKNAESGRIQESDWKLEQRNHEDAMRIIRRIDSIVEFVAESYEAVNDWFMDSDIRDWTYADGELAYGAEDRIEDRLYYQVELDAYIAESRKLYADEAYYRAQVSFGIPARYYVRK